MPGNLDLALRIRADLRQATQQLDRLERELQQTGREARRTGREARAGAEGLDRLGREAQQVGRETRAGAEGLDRLGREAQQAGRETRAVATGLERTERASRGLDRASRRMRRFEGASERAARSLNGFYLAFGGIGAAQLVRSLVEAGLEIEALEQRFNFAAGSIAAGAQELEFVRREAERLGISFSAAAQGYSSLLAAAKGTNISVAETREIFLGIAEAGAVLRLSSHQVQGALTAVEQIISKGKVTAEELRGQLAERLPGAFQIMARALGITTQQLDKALEQGDISARGLVAFARQIREEYGDEVPAAADSAAASFARLGNAIERLQQSVAKSGLLEFLTDLTDRINIAGQQFGLFAKEPGRAVASLRGELIGVDEDLAEAQARVAGLVRELELLEGRDDGISRSARAAVERQLGVAERTLAGLQAQAARLREEIASSQADIPGLQPPGAPGAPAASAAAPGADAEASAREKAEERANAAILRLRRSHIDAYLRIGVDAAELIERRRIEAIRRVDEAEAAGGDSEAAAIARNAIEQRFARELGELYKRQIEDRIEAENRLAERRAEARDDALRDLDAIERGLLGPYDRAAAEVEAWRDATVAAFEEAGVSAAEYGETVDREVTARLARAAEEEADRRLRESRRWQDGAQRAFRDYAESATDAGRNAEEAVTSGFRGMEDALTQFVTTGKLEFNDLANSIIADLARIAIRQTIVGPLAGALFGALGGGVSGPGAVPGGTLFFHGGGRVGGGTQHRRYGIPPAVFARAPRYHEGGIAGLRPNEIPAILERGETVRTAEQERGLQAGTPVLLRAEVVNESGHRLEARQAEATFDPETWTIRVVVDNIAQGGTIGRQIEGIVRQGGL